MKQNPIDMHTHIYPTTLARRAMQVAGREKDDFSKLPVKQNLLTRMKEEKIGLSVVHHVVTKPSTQNDVNRFAREIVRPGILSFGGLHPDCANVPEEIEKLKDLNMAGIKFHPPFQKVHLEWEGYSDMWKRINHLGFPVLIHLGRARVPGEFDLFPSGAEKIIRCLPDVPVILAHMGGRPEDPEEEKILMGFPENVFLDTAMSAERQKLSDFERLAGEYGTDRILFGSDFPYGSQKEAISYIQSTCFSESEKNGILRGNAARILKIQEE